MDVVSSWLYVLASSASLLVKVCEKKSHKCVLTIPVLAAAAAFLARQLLKLPHNIPAVCAKPLQANAHL